MNDFFEKIINCSDHELEKIVREKAMALENEDSTDREIICPNERFYDYQSYYSGFIKKDVKIYFSMGSGDSTCYTLGNYDYLVDIFMKIKKNNINKRDDLLKYLSSIMDDYFGKFNGYDKREEHIIKLGGNVTIDSFKDKGLAACSERAAVVNNILEMLGIKSIYVTGLINGEQHAFNILLNKNGSYYIMDTSYNCGLYDENNNNLGTVSYMFGLGKINSNLEEFLCEGKEFSFYDGIARKYQDGTIKFERNGRVRKYTVEPIKLEEEKSRKR